MNTSGQQWAGEMTSVHRAIMREIESALTWHDVMAGIKALQTARRIYDVHITEMGKLQGQGVGGSVASVAQGIRGLPQNLHVTRGVSENGAG